MSPTPSPEPSSFSETYSSVSDGVVRIDSQTCDDSGSGTGFLIAPDLIATVAHVVSGAATVRITQETRSTSAEVVGLDATDDVALLRTSRPLDGHVFELSPAGPKPGERIGVIGFPAGDSGLINSSAGGKSFKEGSVNGLNRKENIDGAVRTGLVELDALSRSGNSGSPVVRVNGTVVGLLDAGPGDDQTAGSRFAVDSRVASPMLAGWRTTPRSVPATDCSTAVGPDGKPVGFEALPGGESTEVAATLNLYFKSIDQGDYATAYAQMHPDVQVSGGLEALARGVTSSVDDKVQYQSLRRVGRDLVVWTTFESRQDAAHGPDGLTCADWSLDYTMRESDGLWLIEKSSAHDGKSKYVPCSTTEPTESAD